MPKGMPFTPEFKEAVRRAYLKLPRTHGRCEKRARKGKSPKRPGGRVRKEHILPLLKLYQLSMCSLWRIVYDLQPWR